MTLRTQPVKADSHELEATESPNQLRLRLKGTFDMTATPDLSLFLVSVEGDLRQIAVRELIIDVVDVYYLGSSCIKSFVALIEATRKSENPPQVRVLISARLDWHERTFSILARLAPALVTLEKAKN
jgi:anti-anti-sigma regulatory factor